MNRRGSFFVFFAVAFVLTLALNARLLGRFMTGDDLGLLAHVDPMFCDSHWSLILTPKILGFYRPLALLGAWGLGSVWGLTPWPYRLTAAFFHATACGLTGLLAMRLDPGHPRTSWLACLLMASHLASLSPILCFANLNDVFFTIAALGCLLCWDHWLAEGRRSLLLAAAACFAGCIVSKETSVVTPVYLTLWGLMRGAVPRRDVLRALACFFAAAGAYAMLSLWMQRHASSSYINENLMSHNPLDFARQLADYLTTSVLPYLHVLGWPWDSPPIPHIGYWMLRALVWLALAWLFAGVVRGAEGRRITALILSAAAALALPSLLSGPPQIRFLYPSLPFVSLAWALALASAQGGRRRALMTALGLIWGISLAGFWFSPSIARDIEIGRNMRTLAETIERLHDDRSGAPVASIPDYGHDPQAPLGPPALERPHNFFIPVLRASIQINHLTPPVDYVFHYENGVLTLDDATESSPAL